MTHINQRRDTAANWASINPVLQLGEVGWETDTRKSKLGNGTSAWNDLLYTESGLSATKADIGLGQVDNTSDVDKPVSAMTQVALDAKANTSHTHASSDIIATGTPDQSTFLRGDGKWATPERFFALMRRQATQSMINGETTTILWDTTSANPSGWTVGTAGITSPVSGYYQATLKVALDNVDTTGFIHASVVSSGGAGTEVVLRSSFSPYSPTVLNGSRALYVTAGDTVTASVFHNNGANRNIYGGTIYATTLLLQRI